MVHFKSASHSFNSLLALPTYGTNPGGLVNRLREIADLMEKIKANTGPTMDSDSCIQILDFGMVSEMSSWGDYSGYCIRFKTTGDAAHRDAGFKAVQDAFCAKYKPYCSQKHEVSREVVMSGTYVSHEKCEISVITRYDSIGD